MNPTTIAACPKCGQKLGLPSSREMVHVTCPVCAERWDWNETSGATVSEGDRRQASPGRSSNGRRFRFVRPRSRPLRLSIVSVAIVFLGLMAWLVWRHIQQQTSSSPLSGREAKSDSPPEQTLPINGKGVFRFVIGDASGILRVIPRQERKHIVLKVENAKDSSLVCWLFFRAGESVETTIPAGTYHLKIAYGERWYGEKYLFGRNATYTAIADEIKITNRTSHTIDLQRSEGGTFMERNVQPQEF